MQKEETIPKKTCASESHNNIITARNMGIIGIVNALIIILVNVISPMTSYITGLIGIGILSYMSAMRSKRAEYLETTYDLKPKPFLGIKIQKKSNNKLNEGFKI